MPVPFRIIEVSLYSILSFAPYLLLALYPFIGKFRFSKFKTAVLVFLLCILQVIMGLLATFSPLKNMGILSMGCIIIYGAFYFLAIKERPSKLIFVLLMISNFANMVTISSKCLEGMCFPLLAVQKHRWSFSVTSLLLLLIAVPLFYHFLKTQFKEAVTIQAQDGVWNFLWIIPTTFYLFWFHSLYFNTLSSLELALQPMNTFFMVIINLGAIFVYYSIARAMKELSNNMDLTIQVHQLSMQTLQYEKLQKSMEESKKDRHDFRQHIIILSSLLQSKNYDNLDDYLYSFLKVLPPDENILYCEHFALNAILSHYSQLALKQGIDFSCKLSAPQSMNIEDKDLTVLFGNLLENACDSCVNLPREQRFINIQGAMATHSSFVFTIDNPFVGSIQQKEGSYLSSKHKGFGVGIRSVQDIVGNYNGIAQFNIDDSMFCASIVLNFTCK